MTMGEVWDVAGAVILSVGATTAIVLALSSWLGKVWATRIMDKERAAHSQELEKLRDDLQRNSNLTIEHFKRVLDQQIADATRDKDEKLRIYRATTDIVVTLLADLDELHSGQGAITTFLTKSVKEFNRERMRVYAYMAMHAPQSVMDANDELSDHLIDVLQGEVPYEWPQVRARAINLLNRIRVDVGIDKNPIEYRGRR
jgi:hypothetical protein